MIYQRAIEILKLLQVTPTEGLRARRFGGPHDGGYILHNDLSDSDFLISMGVGSDISFEVELAETISGIHLYDHTVEKLPQESQKFTFFQEKVDATSGLTLRETIDRAPKRENLILKMDIEGSEWGLLRQSAELLTRFRQVVIELHGLTNIGSQEFNSVATEVLQNLTSNFFTINVHPNNNGNALAIGHLILPDVVELTLLSRKHYERATSSIEELRSEVDGLNSRCYPGAPELYLQRISRWQDLEIAPAHTEWPNSRVHKLGSIWYPSSCR